MPRRGSDPALVRLLREPLSDRPPWPPGAEEFHREREKVACFVRSRRYPVEAAAREALRPVGRTRRIPGDSGAHEDSSARHAGLRKQRGRLRMAPAPASAVADGLREAA